MSTAAAQADAFYREVIENGVVWTIRDQDGIPAPVNENGRRAMPFWSLRSRAERVIQTVPAYSGFTVVELPVSVWLGKWLRGLERDGLLVGLNWSGKRATGYDVEPREAKAAIDARSGEAPG